jgi:hypothetical protein
VAAGGRFRARSCLAFVDSTPETGVETYRDEGGVFRCKRSMHALEVFETRRVIELRVELMHEIKVKGHTGVHHRIEVRMAALPDHPGGRAA